MREIDERYMELAISEAQKSVSEDERTHPKVGVVVVKNDEIVAVAHRGETGMGDHAEFGALEGKLASVVVAGATVYTTLEPCTTRQHPKVACARRLIERKVGRVVIGMLDPNPDICGKGQQLLRTANTITELFPHHLMSMVEDINREFIRTHTTTFRSVSGAQPNQPKTKEEYVEGGSMPSDVQTVLPASERIQVNPISLSQLLDQLGNKSLTELQRDSLRKRHAGSTVQWEGIIWEVQPIWNTADSEIMVFIHPVGRTDTEGYGVVFPPVQRDALLELQRHDWMFFEGQLDFGSFPSKPRVRNARLLKYKSQH